MANSQRSLGSAIIIAILSIAFIGSAAGTLSTDAWARSTKKIAKRTARKNVANRRPAMDASNLLCINPVLRSFDSEVGLIVDEAAIAFPNAVVVEKDISCIVKTQMPEKELSALVAKISAAAESTPEALEDDVVYSDTSDEFREIKPVGVSGTPGGRVAFLDAAATAQVVAAINQKELEKENLRKRLLAEEQERERKRIQEEKALAESELARKRANRSKMLAEKKELKALELERKRLLAQQALERKKRMQEEELAKLKAKQELQLARLRLQRMKLLAESEIRKDVQKSEQQLKRDYQRDLIKLEREKQAQVRRAEIEFEKAKRRQMALFSKQLAKEREALARIEARKGKKVRFASLDPEPEVERSEPGEVAREGITAALSIDQLRLSDNGFTDPITGSTVKTPPRQILVLAPQYVAPYRGASPEAQPGVLDRFKRWVRSWMN